MHNLKDIRKNVIDFKKKIEHRNSNFDTDVFSSLDKKNRELIQKKEKLEQEKKKISKSKDIENFKKSKDLTEQINLIYLDQEQVQKQINSLLENLPNVALDEVPIGKDETENKIIKKEGNIKKFNYKIKSHIELGDKNNKIDFKISSKLSGSRFVVLKDKFALLERALINLMLDTHTNKFKYTEISPPLMVNENVMFGTGQLPKFEDDQFEIKTDNVEQRKFLIPTAEVVLTNMIRESVVQLDELPLRFVAATPCFRKEAGSYGKDTKGIMRQHQFYKVELVSIVEPNKCNEELERMLNCAEEILKVLATWVLALKKPMISKLGFLMKISLEKYLAVLLVELFKAEE